MEKPFKKDHKQIIKLTINKSKKNSTHLLASLKTLPINKEYKNMWRCWAFTDLSPIDIAMMHTSPNVDLLLDDSLS